MESGHDEDAAKGEDEVSPTVLASTALDVDILSGRDLVVRLHAPDGHGREYDPLHRAYTASAVVPLLARFILRLLPVPRKTLTPRCHPLLP